MSARAPAWATAALGFAVLALFVVFALLPEARAAAGCLPAGSVVQFELARNAADLAAIFGPPESACRPLAIAAMDAVNHVDVAAFIPTYTAFCVCAAMYLAGAAPRPLAIVAVIAALGAAAGDYLETTTLLSLTHALDAPEALLPRLALGAWSKFALLAVHALFCAGLCFFADRRRPILGALLLLPAPAVAIAAFDHMRFANVMNAAFAIAWIALLALALKDAVRPKDAA
jgi:hypothetical protein